MLLLPKTIAKCQGIFPGLCPFLFNSAPTIHHPIHILLKYHYHKAIWIGGHAPHLNNLSYPPSSAFHTLHTLHSCHCLALYRYIPSKHNWCHAIRINPACHSFQVGLQVNTITKAKQMTGDVFYWTIFTLQPWLSSNEARRSAETPFVFDIFKGWNLKT